MPRRKKQKSIPQDSFLSNTFQNTLNENVIICIPLSRESLQVMENDSTIDKNSMTQEQNLYTYHPELSVPVEQESVEIKYCERIKKDRSSSASLQNESAVILDGQIQSIGDTFARSSLNKYSKVCMWCCHEFSNVVVNLPLKYDEKEFIVFGQFCSAECAASYNFHDVIEFGDVWERYSLLHSLYFDTYKGKTIPLAPSRISLSMFGGHLSIEEFRNQNQIDYKLSIAPIKQVKVFSTSKKITKLPKHSIGGKKDEKKENTMLHPFTFFNA